MISLPGYLKHLIKLITSFPGCCMGGPQYVDNITYQVIKNNQNIVYIVLNKGIYLQYNI